MNRLVVLQPGPPPATVRRRPLSVRQAARFLGCAPATVERLLRARAFRGAKRVNGEWRIPGPAVQERALHTAAKVVDGSSRVACATLHCNDMCARDCVLRQQRSDEAIKRAPRERRDHSTDDRGIVANFVSCRTDRCEQGRWIRTLVGDFPMPKRQPGSVSYGAPGQTFARLRAARAGLLDDVPTIDAPLDDALTEDATSEVQAR